MRLEAQGMRREKVFAGHEAASEWEEAGGMRLAGLVMRRLAPAFFDNRWSKQGSGRGTLFCLDRKSTRLNSSHLGISYAVFCLKKNKLTLLPGTCACGCRDTKWTIRIACSGLSSALRSPRTTAPLMTCRRLRPVATGPTRRPPL